MSTQPPAPGQQQVPDPNTIHCPRCSSPIGPEQDWCLECGAPARTRLAQTPNWQLPTVAIGAIVLIAGALLAFAFVKLTNDNGAAPAGTTPAAVVETAPVAPVPPPVTSPVPSATTTAPTGAAIPSTVPGQTPQTTPAAPAQSTPSAPAQTTPAAPAQTTTGGQKTVPAFGSTTTTP